MNGCVPVAVAPETEIHSPHIGKWRVRATLLNLDQSDILLCQQGEMNFTVSERFRHDSPYGKAKGETEILLQGTSAGKLAGDFKVNAQHTLEFMASNLVAKAQKVVWEQFPDHRPAKVVGAISERCRTAIANEETVVEQRRLGQTIDHGMRI